MGPLAWWTLIERLVKLRGGDESLAANAAMDVVVFMWFGPEAEWPRKAGRVTVPPMAEACQRRASTFHPA